MDFQIFQNSVYYLQCKYYLISMNIADDIRRVLCSTRFVIAKKELSISAVYPKQFAMESWVDTFFYSGIALAWMRMINMESSRARKWFLAISLVSHTCPLRICFTSHQTKLSPCSVSTLMTKEINKFVSELCIIKYNSMFCFLQRINSNWVWKICVSGEEIMRHRSIISICARIVSV